MYKLSISGKANSGKNTLAKLLAKNLLDSSQKPKIKAFADPLKKMAKIMFPQIPHKHLYGDSHFRSSIIPGAFKDGKPLTVRQLLLDLGTQVGRGYNDRVWLENFEISMRKIKNCPMLIVPDIRFLNEFDFLKDLGFIQIRILRNESSKIDHESETQQDEILDNQFNFVIRNDKCLSELDASVQKIANQIKAL